MLTKMYLTNFLSFSERTEFDFTASKYSILSASNVSDNNVLKGALVIGPNASGKSNALEGIAFIIKLIKGEGVSFGRYHCCFNPKPSTCVEYEFIFNEKKVSYVISYNVQTKTLSEHLTIDNKDILIRNGIHGELYIGETPIIAEKLDGETLFLRTASFDTGKFPHSPVLHELMEYLHNSYYIDGYNKTASFGKSVTKYAEENGIDKLNSYLKIFNYDFFMEYGSESHGEGLHLRLGSGQKSIFFKRNNFPIPTIFYEESQGNQVFADMLPQIINIIEKPGMLIIDEFGNSLHNKLSEKIVKFVMENSEYSQLFITSHDTNLISNSVFRPDQINLVTFKGPDGSQVKRISSFKPREAQNLEKMYLGGMFEGLPRYEEI
ncbi:MAG: AAA family ATPase [Lachnospiraceae bacterium]|nr:AAA family ATPase [Lachnospiraceae bacterium]